MDYLRAILIPFRPVSLVMIGVFATAITFLIWVASFAAITGLWALVAALLLNVWVLKYCYVVLEHVADGATEPPVMDVDMLSPFEMRPWLQGALLAAGVILCLKLGGQTGTVVAIVLLAALPASVALLGMGENVFQAMNPLAWWRVAIGMGPLYVALLCLLAALAMVLPLLLGAKLPVFFKVAALLIGELAFFSMTGSGIWLRRRQLGFEPSRSPERAAARQEGERLRERARMLDEVFEQVRLGKHVSATAPLARWFAELEPELAARDGLHIAERTLQWKQPGALNAIGSTLVRHLLRFGRPDAALAVFRMFRAQHSQFTMDSAADLRTLADYAESIGKDDLAQSMRLETPVFRP